MENQVFESSNQLETVENEIEYAGFWIRVGATLVDFLTYLPFIGLNMYNLYVLKSLPLQLIITTILFIYKPLMEYKYGATLGKMAVGIKVVNKDFNQITLEQSIFRFLPWIISQLISLYVTVMLFQHPDFADATGMFEVGYIQGEIVSPWINFLGSAFLLISCIVVGFTTKKLGIHDMIAETYCIYKKS